MWIRRRLGVGGGGCLTKCCFKLKQDSTIIMIKVKLQKEDRSELVLALPAMPAVGHIILYKMERYLVEQVVLQAVSGTIRILVKRMNASEGA